MVPFIFDMEKISEILRVVIEMNCTSLLWFCYRFLDTEKFLFEIKSSVLGSWS